MSASLRITLLLSASLHIVCFGIFEPTFGYLPQKLNLLKVSFLGPILQKTDFSLSRNYPEYTVKNIFKQRYFSRSLPLINKEEDDFLTFKAPALKPLAAVSSNKEKVSFFPQQTLDTLNRRKKEFTIEFSPPLPYSFLLYFQDRQIAHIEFMFYISESGKVSSIKRKVSSGNLDVDLLALRYIVHCLNLVEGKFPPSTWQTVKIDLTRRHD